MIVRSLLAAALALGACDQPGTPPRAAVETASLFSETPETQIRLPHRLQEISGLALSPDGRLFGHDDETAIISEIDPVRGVVVKSFALGDPADTGDFEGLAITSSGDFWLTTSRGRLMRFREGADGAHVAFDRFDSGLRGVCEVEGLAYLAPEDSLILACKENYQDAMRGSVALFSWNVAGGNDAVLWRSLPAAEVAAAAGVRAFHPSGVEIDPQTGRILVLSARDGALVEFGPEGQLIAARRLGHLHVQAEGVTVGPDGAMIISDEGAGGRALMTRYGRRQ